MVTLFDDSLEFQLVVYQLGIAHPTGYPLYLLLGKLCTFLPVGDVAYRLNLLSALCGAATVALVYRFILTLTEQIKPYRFLKPIRFWEAGVYASHFGAMSGALGLAVSPVFWQQATLAEVYALNALFVVMILWGAAQTSEVFKTSEVYTEVYKIYILAFLVGLSLTHHRTMVLLLPALAVYLLTMFKPNRFSKPVRFAEIRVVGLSLLLGALPLLLYLYLPLRGHIGSLDGTYQNSWAGFWQQVTASNYGNTFILGNHFAQKRGLDFYGQLFQHQFGWSWLGFIGVAYLGWHKQYRALILTGLAWLTYCTFNFFYHVEDIEVFFIPPFLIWAVWLGLGITACLQFATIAIEKVIFRQDKQECQSFTLTGKSKTFALLTFYFLLLTPYSLLLYQSTQTNYLPLRERNTWRVHDYGLDMVQQPLPQNSAIVGIVGEMTLIRYFQQTENQRPDIQTIAADLEANRLATVEKLLSEGKSVYLTRELAGAAKRWSLSAVGPLIQVKPQPITTPPVMDYTLNQTLTSHITLLGYNQTKIEHHDTKIRLTLFWQAVTTIPLEVKLSARLLNTAGQVVSVVDGTPVHFAYPTTAWHAGEVVADVYDLPLADLSAGQYRPLLIGYDPANNATEVGRIQLNNYVKNWP